VLEAFQDSPFPQVVPPVAVLLPLQRPYWILGRVVHADGSPAADAQLDVEVLYKQPAPAGIRVKQPTAYEVRVGAATGVASSVSLTVQDAAGGPDGRFTISIRDTASRPWAHPSATAWSGGSQENTAREARTPCGARRRATAAAAAVASGSKTASASNSSPICDTCSPQARRRLVSGSADVAQGPQLVEQLLVEQA
jgi:hypothetical protein